MAEFLAIHHTDASLLPCLFRRLRGRATLGPPESAAGLGFFQSDDVLVRKRPVVGTPTLEKLTEGVESEAALIATGSLTRSFAEESTFPLRWRQRRPTKHRAKRSRGCRRRFRTSRSSASAFSTRRVSTGYETCCGD